MLPLSTSPGNKFESYAGVQYTYPTHGASPAAIVGTMKRKIGTCLVWLWMIVDGIGDSGGLHENGGKRVQESVTRFGCSTRIIMQVSPLTKEL